MISSDGAYALSASWDKTLRLWELSTGETTRRFVGHGGDVLSVSFSADNRQIVSGSRDRSIKLWNTLGDCKFTITDKGHTEWVSCVRFSPNPQNPVIVSAGWDKLVKVSFFFFVFLRKFLYFLHKKRGEVQKMLCNLSICYFRDPIRSMRQTITNALMISLPPLNALTIAPIAPPYFCANLFQGLGTGFLPYPDRPHRSLRLHQHCHHLP